jgi:hypothetical protein
MKGFLKIVAELGNPPIFLVSPRQFKAMEGDELHFYRAVGIASVDYPIIAIYPGLQGKARDNTIYHEIAHHLWPWRPHWWIECFGEKMAGGGGRGYYSGLSGHTPNDLPSRKKLLEMARRQSNKLKDKYKIKK